MVHKRFDRCVCSLMMCFAMDHQTDFEAEHALRFAEPCCAVLCCAVLCCAVLSCAMLGVKQILHGTEHAFSSAVL